MLQKQEYEQNINITLSKIIIPGGRSKRMKNGGQSASRFLNSRQSQIQDFAKRIALAAVKGWIKDGSVVMIRAFCFVCLGASELKVQVMDEMKRESPGLAQHWSSASDITCCTDTLSWEQTTPWLQDDRIRALTSVQSAVDEKHIQQLWERLSRGDSEQRLVFGLELIERAATEGMLETLWLHESLCERFSTGSTQMIIVPVSSRDGIRLLDEFQGVVGLLHRGTSIDWILATDHTM